MKFELLPVIYTDVPALARISAEAFARDPHAQVKQLGRKPIDMFSLTSPVITQSLNRESIVYMKAVDNEENELPGFCCWGYRVDTQLVPRADPGMLPSETANEEDGEEGSTSENDSIDRLNTLEAEDMKRWMDIFMPDETTQCLYIQMLCVAPHAHGKGLGSALVLWRAAVADRLGLFTWVQASEKAYRVLSKHSFGVVGDWTWTWKNGHRTTHDARMNWG
ncbi:hypothetical protein DPSP01_014101 [Paraphaeosphaeria sporulosa]